MPQENQSSLRFSLEESVWFQKGQEVEELYSLSLDPNVTIHESEQYVLIKGSLDLHGEYKNDLQTGELLDYTNTGLPRTVQHVERQENGIHEFTHRFPVDITIPTNRISSLDDIDVAISSFDYAMPERNCLKLQADLIISGIYSEPAAYETENREEPEEEYENPVQETAEENTQDDPASYDSYEQEDEADYIPYVASPPSFPDFQPQFREEVQIDMEDSEQEEALFEPFSAEAKRAADEEEQAEEEPAADPLNAAEDIPIFENTFQNLEEKPPFETELMAMKQKEIEEKEPEEMLMRNQSAVLDPPEETEPEPELEVAEPLLNDQEEPAEAVLEEPQEAEEEPERNENEKGRESGLYGLLNKRNTESDTPAVQKYKGRKADKEDSEEESGKESLSIMDFFGRKQEEELVKVKVCIVQQGETLDQLAKRYDVSLQTLLYSNELEPNHDVYEGQVLYIPKR
ncbi:stage VI sporulation protein D [Bacillus massiliglaciei]|uniref:stage VI sporulation protein D n=1 Tax=Bacillus massiliglaciei TaxID=1816693 RepID=UPI000A6C5175|nr:stage VI sporulation protein D [Bacillus massiliglaciei]